MLREGLRVDKEPGLCAQLFDMAYRGYFRAFAQ